MGLYRNTNLVVDHKGRSVYIQKFQTSVRGHCVNRPRQLHYSAQVPLPTRKSIYIPTTERKDRESVLDAH